MNGAASSGPGRSGQRQRKTGRRTTDRMCDPAGRTPPSGCRSPVPARLAPSWPHSFLSVWQPDNSTGSMSLSKGTGLRGTPLPTETPQPSRGWRVRATSARDPSCPCSQPHGSATVTGYRQQQGPSGIHRAMEPCGIPEGRQRRQQHRRPPGSVRDGVGAGPIGWVLYLNVAGAPERGVLLPHRRLGLRRPGQLGGLLQFGREGSQHAGPDSPSLGQMGSGTRRSTRSTRVTRGGAFQYDLSSRLMTGSPPLPST